jgi:hypothetical protein
MIESATDDLLSSYHFDLLEGLLSMVEKPGPPGIDMGLFQSLKLARKKLIILRSAFQLATKDHEVPIELDRMVRSLGHLNDMLAYGPKEEIPNEAAKARKYLREVRKSKILERTPKLASKKSLLKYLRDKRNDIAILLRKKTISIDEFHKVRKGLKVFLTFFYFFESKGADGKSTYQDLNTLVTQMGEVNDILTERILKGLTTKKEKIAFPKELKDQIETFLEKLRLHLSEH